MTAYELSENCFDDKGFFLFFDEAKEWLLKKIFLSGKIRFSQFIFIFFFFWQTDGAQSYLWPTNASRLMTSSFCEFRPRHYHAAIDIKTWNRTGYKIFAIEDGYVMRVRVSAFGYGRALYVKLRDGNIVVYAHLKRFWPALENYVYRIRRKRRQYRVDLHLKAGQFPVKRGQVLGDTGKSGIGVPHLHFEIRNSRNEPINPLQFYRNVIRDELPPVLYRAAFIPLDSRSLIDLRTDTVFVDLPGQSQAVLKDTLLFSGRIGLALKTYDRANGARNHFAFYRARMWVDDSLVYSVQYDKFSYDQTALIELDKNFSLWRKNLGIFHNFFRDPANRLPHYDDTPSGGGIISSADLKEGLHTLRVHIEDYWQNSAKFEMVFRTSNPQPLQYDLFRQMENELFLRLISPVALQDISVLVNRDSTGWEPLGQVEQQGQARYEGQYYYALSVKPETDITGKTIKLQGITPAHTPSLPLYLRPNHQNERQSTGRFFRVEEWRVKQDWLEWEIKPLRQNPENFLYHLGEQLPDLFWFPLDSVRFRTNIPISVFSANKELLSTLLGDSLPEVYPVHPLRHRKIFSSDNLFSADFPPGSLYRESAVFITTSPDSTDLLPVESPYRRIGKIYDLQPFDQPVNRGVWVKLAVPKAAQGFPGVGLYYWDSKKGWLFIPSQYDSSRYSFTARVTSLEKFTLIQDTIPPLLIPAQPQRGGILISRNGYLTFVLRDEMSGIQKESQIQVFVNREWHLFEYDPEDEYLALKIPFRRRSPSKVKIIVRDNSGNITERIFLVR